MVFSPGDGLARALDGLTQRIPARRCSVHALGKGRLGRIEDAAFHSLLEAVAVGLALGWIGLRPSRPRRLLRPHRDLPTVGVFKNGTEAFGIEELARDRVDY